MIWPDAIRRYAVLENEQLHRARGDGRIKWREGCMSSIKPFVSKFGFHYLECFSCTVSFLPWVMKCL